MDFIYKPKNPPPPSAFDAALAAAMASMGPEAKRAFIESLDLHEPVARLARYPSEKANPRYQDSHVSVGNVFGAILATGDRQAIDAAIASESFAGPQTMISSRGFDELAASFHDLAIRAALVQCDALALEGIVSRAESIDRAPHGLHKLYALAGMGSLSEHAERADYGTFLWSFARSADSRPQADVAACADWIRDCSERTRQAMWMMAQPKKGSKTAKKADEEYQERKRQTIQGLLHLACEHASSNLSKAALDAGAQGSLHAVAAAFEHGAPALARDCLAKWLAQKPADNAALDSRFLALYNDERDRHHSKNAESKLASPQAALFAKLCSSLGSLLSSLAKHNDKFDNHSDKQEARERIIGIGEDLHAFILLAAGIPLSDPTAILGQTMFAGFAISMASELPEPASLTRALRSAHPLPDPSELATLFQRGKSALFKTRAADAAKALALCEPCVAEAWRSRMAELCALNSLSADYSATSSYAPDAKNTSEIQARLLVSDWPARMAIELSASPMGWTRTPVEISLEKITGRAGELLAQAFAEREALDIAKEASTSQTAHKYAPRL